MVYPWSSSRFELYLIKFFFLVCSPEKRKMEREEPGMEKRGRMTRATKTLLAQQHQLIDVDKALEFLAKKTPQLVVNHDGLKVKLPH